MEKSSCSLPTMAPLSTETASANINVQVNKSNIGVFTNPNHELWVGEAQPSLESIRTGKDLKEGEVTINIKSTGICGQVITLLHRRINPLLNFLPLAPTFIFGTLVVLVP